jgi:heat shock protein HtpX
MWEQIQSNRRRSLVLITGMVAVLLVLGYVGGEALAPGGGRFGLLAALVIWMIQMLVYFAAGESILLNSANAHELERDDNPRLFNIVEEMKIASGLGHMPRVFLIDEPTPNAFAVGRTPERAAVAVTTGLMQRLNRDELQGVIGHEIGHIKNLDIRFMTLAGVMLGSIIMLSDLFWRILRGSGRSSSRSRSRGGGGGHPIFLLIGLLFVILAPILAQLLYFACSRKREYLADASAAQFTRYPAGLASALEKLALAQRGLSFDTKVTAPMFIVSPLAASGSGGSLFSTHPPTSERVRILRTMAGAGWGDYEAAFRQIKGGASAIGAAAIQLAPHQEMRAASDEGGAGFAVRDVRTMVNRLDGYVSVTCACGLKTNVPMNFERNEVHCVRCGTPLTLPSVQERQSAPVPAASPQPAAEDLTPLEYTRATAGWESFRCQCGHTLQLSPSFRGTHLNCNKCRRRINIMPLAA